MDYTVHGILQARILEWVDFSLLQGIFPTQRSNPGFPHYRQILYQLSHTRETYNLKRYIHHNVCFRIIYNNQNMEPTYYIFINKGIDKEDVIHIHNGILLNHKKEKNHAICSNMDGPRECHTE